MAAVRLLRRGFGMYHLIFSVSRLNVNTKFAEIQNRNKMPNGLAKMPSWASKRTVPRPRDQPAGLASRSYGAGSEFYRFPGCQHACDEAGCLDAGAECVRIRRDDREGVVVHGNC